MLAAIGRITPAASIRDLVIHFLSFSSHHTAGHTPASTIAGILNNPPSPSTTPPASTLCQLLAPHNIPAAATVGSRKNNSALAIFPSHIGRVVNTARAAVLTSLPFSSFPQTLPNVQYPAPIVPRLHNPAKSLNQNWFPPAAATAQYKSGGLLSWISLYKTSPLLM